jgi:hypothetical protein
MDIKKASTMELKGLAYDLLALNERTVNDLKLVNQEIQSRPPEPVLEPAKEPVVKHDYDQANENKEKDSV